MVQQTISATTINSFDARKYVFGTTCGLVSGIAASSSKTSIAAQRARF